MADTNKSDVPALQSDTVTDDLPISITDEPGLQGDMINDDVPLSVPDESPPPYALESDDTSLSLKYSSTVRPEFTEDPMEVHCFMCLETITTVTEYHYSKYTWMTMAALFLLGCWPCIPIPLCVKSLMDVAHYCPICRTFLGIYYRF
ncbi:lipopolysaccharide-induced tumor necrosis factor-alpha factor homolog [Gigantopelta aegis]|uniref:lipopolysaccharide-induced tumor necrosis factor-alpha factor homolog n=1 Tax=Gigantopelta aegis TaxID=1735272 RepID=UPI001B8892C0|nr:lipopolysaccharide-induced tumor necrosis factor-alpha factor homolog [Gigantopelta aegis]